MLKVPVFVLTIAFAAVAALGQAPTLRIVQPDGPDLPAQLYYGNVLVKPLRLRPGTNQVITINDADFFVQQQYVDFLSRFPDQSGFDFWLNQITGCGSNASCIDGQRTNTSGAFFLSIEFQETGYLVERLYKTAYGDAMGTSTFGGTQQLSVPIIRLSEFKPDSRQIAQGVIVGQGNWQAQLEANKQSFIADFVSRSRFTTEYPTTMSAADFVNKLSQNVGVNVLSATERDALVTQLAPTPGSSTLRAQVLRAVAEDRDLDTAEKNKAFVLMQYFGYLRRNPNELQDSDYTGYDFWLTKLNNHGGDFHAAEMVKSFIVSGEYAGRF
jgi:hypothetical protein